jgi:hypothetical protein
MLGFWWLGVDVIWKKILQTLFCFFISVIVAEKVNVTNIR